MAENNYKKIFKLLFAGIFLFLVFAFLRGENFVLADASSTATSTKELNTNFVQEGKTQKKEVLPGDKNFNLKLISEKKDFAVSELPELEFKFRRKQNIFKTFYSFLRNLFVDDYQNMQIHSAIIDDKTKNIDIAVEYKGGGKFLTKLKNKNRELRIGKHKIRIFIKDENLTNGKEVYFDQDFTWGVLALNFNKSVFLPGEENYIQMAVLDDEGDTLCDAQVDLEIINPKNKKIKLSSKKNEIIKNKKCGHNNVINEPDYYAYFKVEDLGEYKVKMIARTKNGERVIEDKFFVKKDLPFEIERIAPTRIYPYADYKIKLKIKVNQSYKGEFGDLVPYDFIIKKQSVKVNSILLDAQFSVEEEDGVKRLVWKDLDLKKGDILEIEYKVDFPNISPEFYLLGEAKSSNFSESRNWQIASDAVGAGVAWLSATSTTYGKNLNQVSSYALVWSDSDYDTTKYFHSTSTNATRLTIKESGDYFLALNIPMIREDANSSRTRIEAEVRVNGSKADIGVARSSYIRNYNSRNNQASDNLHILLKDLSANDYVEVYVHGITTVDAGDSVIIYDLATLYLEKVDDKTVFFAKGTETTNSTNLNDTAYEVKWDTEVRKDSGFTHSESANPEDITLDDAGYYLVFVNIPLSGAVTRANVIGKVLLDGTKIDGGVFKQGYIRNTESDTDSSIHFAGVVHSTSSNQILSISTEAEAGAGTVTVGADKATIYVQKISSDDSYLGLGTELSSGTDWNQVGPVSILWQTDDLIDTNTFTHSTASNAHQITVKKSGDYFLTYNDSLTAGSGRPNPIINILVNGSEVSGAQVKSHYIRAYGGHNESSAGMTFLLKSLSANDVVSVTTKRETDTDTVDDNDYAMFFLNYRENNVHPVASINSIAQKTDGSGAIDISTEVVDGNNDDVRLKIEYVANATCDFSSPTDPSLDSTDANITADYGDPDIDNNYAYQVGTSTAMILTDSGANTVQFDWLSKSDIPNASSTYCIRITANDGKADQDNPATSTITIDNYPPQISKVEIPNLDYAIGDTLTATITVEADTDTFSLDDTCSINNASTTNLQKINNTTYTLDYVVGEGDTDRSAGSIPVSIVLRDSYGNTNSPFTSVESNTASIDANSPDIISVSAPNILYGIGDTLTATITVSADTETYTLVSGSTINNKSIGNLQKINDTTYTVDYVIAEGDTDRASGTIPISISLRDDAGNENSPFTTLSGDSAIDAHRPVVQAVYITNGDYGIGDSIKLIVDADESGYSLGNATVNNKSVSSLTDLGDTTYEIYYTVEEGDTDRSAGTIPVSIVMRDSAGNENSPFTSPSSNTASVDAHKPEITGIYFPDLAYKIGDTLTATVTVSSDADTYSLGTSTINNVAVTNLQKINDSTYTVDYLISEGDTDRSAGTIPASIVLKDSLGQYNDPPYTSVESNTASIDANPPVISALTFNPSSGVLKVGDTATATITLANSETGATAGLTVKINNVSVVNTFTELGGGDYRIVYTVSEGDNDHPDADDLPVYIIVKDSAGNESDPYQTADPSNRPGVDGNSPTISNVTFNPTSGTLKVGDTATATISSDASGYTAGTITINSVDVSSTLIDNGDNTYTVTYTVSEGDTDIDDSSDLPINISLKDSAGNESDPYQTADPSNRPGVDGNSPTISNVTFTPTSGTLKVGDTATATISSDASGYTAGTITINSVDVSSTLVDNGDNTYTVTYTVSEGDTDIDDSNDLPINISLKDSAGNESTAYQTADPANRPGVDGNSPTISNVTFTPTSGTLKVGDTATATISSDASGYTAGTITINSVDVSSTLVDNGDSTYTVTYTVSEGDTDIDDSSDLPINISLKDSAGNESDPYQTADPANRPGVDGNSPDISSVSFLPSSGLLKIGAIATATVQTIESGCSALVATINGKDVSGTMIDNGDGTYDFVYTVAEGDTDIADSADLPVSFTLVDSHGNTGANYNTVDPSNRPGVDAHNPVAPGNLSFSSRSSQSITLNFGSQSSDTNFSEYKIYYKVGTSGVGEGDNLWDKNSDPNLGYVDYNGAGNTTITGLATGTTYVFNIWAYDSAGNKSSATEISARTNAYPTLPGSLSQKENDGTIISNGSWIDQTTVKLSASTTDQDDNETLSLYYELIDNGSSFTSAQNPPANACALGVNYSSCSSHIWVASSSIAAWYDNAWSYRKKITIDADKVLSTESGFVVLATTTDSDLANYARDDAYDILFTASDGTTKLNYDREYWASSSGELVAWIKTDISSTTDTIIYMYYGNSGASTDNASSTAVWDSDYKAVYHMNDTPTGTVYDRTANNNDMTPNGGMTADDLVSGYIGRALDFDGSDDFLKNASPSAYGTADDYTMTAWFYNSSQSGWSNFYSHTTSAGDYDPQWAMNGTTVAVYDGGSIDLGTLNADNAWHRIDYVRSGSTVRAYIDGVLLGSGSHSGTLNAPTAIYIAESGDSNGEFWSGKLDEIRYSETARSLSSLRTEYNNQKDVNSFLSFSEAEQGSNTFAKEITISSIPQTSSGYKWQVLACDDEGACSSWAQFNATTPNFSIDLAPPTKPGALTANTINNTNVILNFGATTTEANFSEYRIYYKIGSTTDITESDNLFASSSDPNLADILFNGASTTTIDNLTAATTYSFNIWAYDVAGNKASSSVLVLTTTGGGNPPTAYFNSAEQKSDGSGVVDISIEVDDVDNDDILRAKIEYVAGDTCDFSSPLDPTLDDSASSISADYGDPVIDNNQTYQVGSSSGWILTSPGSNTVSFDWFAKTDLPSADGVYCLRLTVNDGTADQSNPATTTLIIDNVNPSAPGSLTVSQKLTDSVVLSFGAQGSDSHFSKYRIFYKLGDSGVSVNDNEHIDNNLNYIDYNGATSTTVTGLSSGVDYVFNIWTYDDYGNYSGATEVLATTNYTPDTPTLLKQKKNDGTEISNGELIDDNDVRLFASSSDVNSGEAMSFYYQLLDNSSSFETSNVEPSNYCSSGTEYNSCSAKIWAASTTANSGPPGWYDSDWIYRKKITIDADKVVANETGFVALVNITDSDLAGKVRNDGYDIVFTDENGTKLDYDREYIDSQNGELVAWVKTDVSSTTDTVLYMYYGNGNATTDNASSTAVWDGNYKGVWHLNNNPTGVIEDSTANGNDMTSYGSMTSEDLVDGFVGRALDFDGSNDFIGTTTVSGYGTPGDYTVTAWFYNSSQSGWSNFYSHTTSNGDYDPQWAMNNSNIELYDGSAVDFGTYSADNSWHRVDYVRSGSTVNVYVDGVFFNSGTHSDTLGVPIELWIANSGDTRTEYWSGKLDEVRYSETARDVDLIKTEFNNQSDPSSFMSFGSEETYKYVYSQNVLINNLPDSNIGYKWQVMACDTDGACSSWQVFNATTPNIKVDASAPSSPGALTLNSQTATSITLNFGAQTVENNFTEYKIFYKQGSGGVSEADNEWASSSDANLGYIDYNGASSTTITGLSAGTDYVFNIWAYDVFGRKASSSAELSASTNYFPQGSFVSAQEKTDGSGAVDISTSFSDSNGDDLKAKLEYVAGSACDFSSPLDPTLDETDANATSTYDDAKIENDNTYQIGNTSGWIKTASGTNIVNFDWLSATDESSADGVYCLRLTANDGVDDQEISATTTLTIDNVSPSAPGNLSLSSRRANSLTLSFGAQSTETNFKEYKIFYKEGAATVSENDTEHIDSNLSYIDYNGATTTTINSLKADTQYSFKIYAYDDYGHLAESGQVTFKTNALPTVSINSIAEKTDASGIVDISLEVYDSDGDDVEVKVEYVSGSACDFSSPSDPTLDENTANISADYGLPGIDNAEEYQVGTNTAMIITSSGANTIQFDWTTVSDIPSASGVYCLRFTARDNYDISNVVATGTLVVDNVDPVAPGDLTIDYMGGLSARLNFGSQAVDDYFKEYKIFYKKASSGVTENDLEFNLNDDASLGYIDYNGSASTTITGLSQSSDYVFNIWVYDDYGHKANATEVASTTLTLPSATWREAEDVLSPTVSNYLGREEPVRLRLEVANTGDWTASNYSYRLEYGAKETNCADISNWIALPTSATTEHWQMYNSPYFSDGELTTAKLANTESYNFVSGLLVEDDAIADPISLAGGDYTEIEYTFEATATASSGQTYCFRVTDNGTEIDTYNQYPEITLAPPPSGSFNFASQKTDGSNIVDISIEVEDLNGDLSRAKLEYVAGASCDFSSPSKTTLLTDASTISADYGLPIIDNGSTYQVGTSSGMIITEYGSNTVNFDWDTNADLSNADDTYCLRLTVNDGYDDQTSPATTTVVVDHVSPTVPGDLSQVDISSNSVTVGFGTSSSDTHFAEYRIYYKEGSGGVTESDNLWSSSSDPNLAYADFNGATTTTITGLETNKQYTFKIWAYDAVGNKSYSSGELTVTIKYVSVSENWQWFYDEYNETPTSSIAVENTAPNTITDGAKIKLRLALREIENITGENVKIRLQYSTYSDFSSDVHFVGEAGSSTVVWTYTDGVDEDDDPISTALLSGISQGATHNESGVSTSTYDHVALSVAEWEFTIRNNGASDYTTYYFRAYDNTNKEPIEKNSGFSFPSLMTESGSISYTVSGFSAGSSTEGITTNISTTPNSVPFGTLIAGSQAIGAQRFTITTNAESGYQLLAYSRSQLISNNGADIDPINGTNEVPTNWNLGTSSSAFGYHTGDDTLSGSSPSRFAADNTYARFETQMKEVSYSPLPVSGENVDIVFRTEISQSQEAGDYETDIVYILVPTFY